jgi:transcriptional regulator with XRE-family HTH domain
MIQTRPGVAFAGGGATVARKRDTLGVRLAAARAAAGISQYRLAQLAGVTKQTVSKVEKDETVPSWVTVVLLAKALGVSCEQLVSEDIQLPPPPPVKRPGPKADGPPAAPARRGKGKK